MIEDKYYKKHLKNIEEASKKIKAIYLDIIKEASQLAKNAKLDTQNEFYFKNNPSLQAKIKKLVKSLENDVFGVISESINTSWNLAVELNNEIAFQVYGSKFDELPTEYQKKYLSNNAIARKAFVERKIAGLDLSTRIWKYSQQFMSEMELAIEYAIYNGQSAASLARDIQQYMNNPNKLFRRVRDKSGELRLSKAAKAYHPGAGIYRSSYKNAFRLTRNEINFSYERSRYEKRQQQDFVVGIQIKVSPAYSEKLDRGGVNCYYLQGRYPKDFDFTYKWHVSCRCQSFDILKSREEMDKDLQKILSGEAPSITSKNTVSKIPIKYSNYVKEFKYKNRTFNNN